MIVFNQKLDVTLRFMLPHNVLDQVNALSVADIDWTFTSITRIIYTVGCTLQVRLQSTACCHVDLCHQTCHRLIFCVVNKDFLLKSTKQMGFRLYLKVQINKSLLAKYRRKPRRFDIVYRQVKYLNCLLSANPQNFLSQFRKTIIDERTM